MKSFALAVLFVGIAWLGVSLPAQAEEPAKPTEAAKPDTSRGDKMVAEYFRQETVKLAQASLADIKTLDDWTGRRDQYRQQLFRDAGPRSAAGKRRRCKP